MQKPIWWIIPTVALLAACGQTPSRGRIAASTGNTSDGHALMVYGNGDPGAESSYSEERFLLRSGDKVVRVSEPTDLGAGRGVVVQSDAVDTAVIYTGTGAHGLQLSQAAPGGDRVAALEGIDPPAGAPVWNVGNSTLCWQTSEPAESSAGDLLCRDARNDSSRTYELPGVPRSFGQSSVQDGHPVKGGIALDSPILRALTLDAQGDLLAVVSKRSGAVVEDLDAGSTVELPDGGRVLGFAASSSASAVVWASDPRESADAVTRYEVDLVKHVATSARTTLVPAGMDVVSASAAVTATGESALLLNAGAGGTQASMVASLSDGKLVYIKLPDDVGNQIASASGSQVYVFGGEARNKVSRIDLISGEVVSDSALSSPEGTTILALARS